jgi:23S rRNA (uracil1939-C5)-methyltransferase
MLPPVVKRGSLRLRISPSGERGLWLDFSHEDMKALFEEGAWLQGLLAAGVLVDVGQRRKPLAVVEGRLKLSKEPRLHAWFETVIPAADGAWVATPLFMTVASFSQPGFAANSALVRTVVGALSALPRGPVLELFSGSGNLSVALAAAGFTVSAWELDPLARSGAELAWAEAQKRGVAGGGALTHHTGDLYSKLTEVLPAAPLWVVDPPRGGLGPKLLALLASPQGPEALLYVSCHSEALAADVLALQHQGFDIVSVQAVDQFPQTPHAEWVVLCKK